MLPASNRGFGSVAAYPDTCLTPMGLLLPVPIPYFNTAFNSLAAVFSPNILLTGFHALFLGSVIAASQGDEEGIYHYSIKGPAVVLFGNIKVFLNFLPAATLTSPASTNAVNAIGMLAVPSITNVFMTYAKGAPEEPAGSERHASQRALADAMRDVAVAHELGDEGVGRLRLPLFTAAAVARAEHLLDALLAAGARALEIDLRGNRGGDMKAAMRLADRFLPRGASLGALVEADGDLREFRARRRRHDLTPVTVRVDGETASAAELFAGTLQVHSRARLAGERTYGKSTVQMVAGPPGAGEYMTVAAFRLADGRALPPQGLTPDVP